MKKVELEFVTFTNSEKEVHSIVESILDKFGGDIAGGCRWSIGDNEDFIYEYTIGDKTFFEK